MSDYDMVDEGVYDRMCIRYEAEIARLRALLSDAVALLEQMPIKHPQQGERRDALLQRYVGLLEK